MKFLILHFSQKVYLFDDCVVSFFLTSYRQYNVFIFIIFVLRRCCLIERHSNGSCWICNKNNSLSVSKQVTCQVSAVSIDKGKDEIM